MPVTPGDASDAPPEVVRFLLQEARLLDEARYDDWLALFTADAWYWVPLQADQKDPLQTISLMYDDRRLLETRVRRLSNPHLHAQQPRSRTSRIVANISVEDGGKLIRSKLLMVEYRRDQQRLFAATVLHHLAETDAGLKIASKRVDLVNSDGVLEGLVVPF